MFNITDAIKNRVKGVGRKIKRSVKNTSKKIYEDLSGISSERKALDSDAFKRFKADHSKEAMMFEEQFKKRTKLRK